MKEYIVKFDNPARKGTPHYAKTREGSLATVKQSDALRMSRKDADNLIVTLTSLNFACKVVAV